MIHRFLILLGLVASLSPIDREQIIADVAATTVYVSYAGQQIQRTNHLRAIVLMHHPCLACDQFRTTLISLAPSGWRIGIGKRDAVTEDVTMLDLAAVPDLHRQYRPRVTPTTVLIDSSGREVARAEGAMSAASFVAWCDTHGKRAPAPARTPTQ
jgi:thioredoxin-related protein